jgi:hypothetical protein
MIAFARPAALASVLVAAALCLHPALRSEAWLPARELALSALLLACAAGLVARALATAPGQRTAPWTVAAGVLLALGGLAFDGVRGRHGTLRVSVGQARSHFDEVGPAGRALGLRPLGFMLGVERLTATGAVALASPGRAAGLEVTADHAAAIAGYRFAQPRVAATGGAARLRVSVTDGARTDVADVAPGQPGRAGDVAITLEQYFPDFALDDKQRPFTRSLEPRNPAALLTVERAGQSYRAFVIRSLPGVHRVEPLGLTFSLLDAEPEQEVELAVHREPAAVGVLGGGVLVALGVALGLLRSRPEGVPLVPPAGTAAAVVDPALPAGVLYVVALLLADGARLVSWSFGVPSPAGRVPLPGVGIFLAVPLLAAVAGTLGLAAVALAGLGATAAGRFALWLAVSTGGAGLVLAVVRVAVQPETTLAMAQPVTGIALGLALVAFALRGWPAWLLPAAVVVSSLAAVAASLVAVSTSGTYAGGAATAAAATVLLGLGALAPTGLELPRRLAFLVALVALIVRPA